MKYGVILNRDNTNFGDDIQAYATSQFYPQVDYMIDRERMERFVSDDGEPVAVIMNAWYMWRKWNWPPTKYIYPFFVGFHYSDHEDTGQPGSPIKYEFLTGKGGDYLRDWGPVGTRDNYTKDQLKKLGIDSMFTGCITLTLPKQEKKDMGRYICVVDVDEQVTKRIRKQLKGTGIRVKVMSHRIKKDKEKTWEQRKAEVIERLTVYQNAICVVTKRLHCALPCLAMEVPVLLVKDQTDDVRFDPYYGFLHWVRPADFLKGKCRYDFANPPENSRDYLPVREDMIKRCREFVESVKDDTRSVDEINRFECSEEELYRWRIETVKQQIEPWRRIIEKEAREYSDTQKQVWKMLRQAGEYRQKYGFIKRVKHIFYIMLDSTYKNHIPDHNRMWNNLNKELKQNSKCEDGIEKLRREDELYRALCNRLLHFTWMNFKGMRTFRKEIARLNKKLE